MAFHNLYRPVRFDDVIGQDHVTRTLTNAAISGRLNEYQALLFVGTRGCGKTTCARILARLVNCLDPKDGQPCNSCENCKTVDRCLDGRGGDVIELDAASNRSVEDIERILDACQYKPVGKLKKKVFILDEAHQLSSYAKDALLKTLEEPPPHVLFILATTEAHKIPPTVASRCIRHDFRNGDIASLSLCAARALGRYGVAYDEAALTKAAQLACGSYREVLGIVERLVDLSEKVTVDALNAAMGVPENDVVIGAVRAICAGDQRRCISITSDVITSGKDVRAFIREVVNTLLKGAVMMVEREARKSQEGLTPDQLLEVGTYIFMNAATFESDIPSLVPGLVLAGAARLVGETRPVKAAA